MTRHIDIFNGDADGLCSLQQLRLQEPCHSELVTGLKRDILLLNKITAKKGDLITVLDVSLDTNRQPLLSALNSGAKVFYCDHHFTGKIPKHDNLTVNIDLSADTCTALIINKYLKNAFPEWAIVGAFGDNQDESAFQLAKMLNLKKEQLELLKKLGICLNYNGYGFTLKDLIFHPADLFKKLHSYQSPFDFIQKSIAFKKLLHAFEQDIFLAEKMMPDQSHDKSEVYILPDEKWARRISGVFGNQLARQTPKKAHAILVAYNNAYRVSVRAPLANKNGANELCKKFKGGGRKAAAGINLLPKQQLKSFVRLFKKQFN